MVGAGYARYGGYETSLCHGWSSGPAAWLLSAVLGIAPAEPGFACVCFAPDLGGLDWAEGSVPTRFGLIQVRLERRDGKSPLAVIELPPGMRLQIPDSVGDKWEIKRVGAGFGD